MAKIIEITSSKIDDMYELVEDMLMSGGRLMSCLERMSEDMYGEREEYGNRYPRRDYDDMIGERRYGRYSRREYDDMMGERRYGRKGR